MFHVSQFRMSHITHITSSYRYSVFQGDPLQGVTVGHPVLQELLPQRRRHAGRAAVRADLGPGQALGQLAVRLGARPGPGEDGLAEASPSSIPQRQHGRELRHLLRGDRYGAGGNGGGPQRWTTAVVEAVRRVLIPGVVLDGELKGTGACWTDTRYIPRSPFFVS